MCMFDNALSLGYLLSAKERERRVSHIKILIRSSIYFTILLCIEHLVFQKERVQK